MFCHKGLFIADFHDSGTTKWNLVRQPEFSRESTNFQYANENNFLVNRTVTINQRSKTIEEEAKSLY